MDEETKEYRVGGSADRLVEKCLGDRVALVKARGLLLLLLCSWRGGSSNGIVGRKCGLKKVLPEEVGRRGEQREEGVLEDGNEVDNQRSLCAYVISDGFISQARRNFNVTYARLVSSDGLGEDIGDSRNDCCLNRCGHDWGRHLCSTTMKHFLLLDC